MPLREKNGAIRAVFETETQQIEPDTSQWEGRVLACPPETLTWSQGTAKSQLSFPKQGRAICSCSCAFTNAKTKNAKARLTVLEHLQLLAGAAVPLPAPLPVL